MKKILLFMLGALVALPGIARNFTYEYEGKSLSYTVLDEEAKTCKTKDGFEYGNNHYSGNSISGKLIIPDVAKDGDTEYSVTSLGEYAFYGCSNLTSVTLPESLTSIGGSAFEGCSGLTSVALPESLTSIGYRAFYGCSGLTSVTFPESLTSIDASAFYGCRALTSVTLPESLTSIGGGAFEGCRGLTSVTFPESLTSIGYRAFEGCSGLTSVTFPESLTSIGYEAFYGCSGLTSVKSTAMTPPEIGDTSFEGLYASVPLSVPAEALDYYLASPWGFFENIRLGDSEETVAYKTFETGNLKYRLLPAQTDGDRNLAVVVPGDYSALTEVTIPERITVADNGVTERYYVDAIGYRAFEGCENLTTVTFNSRSGCRVIGESAFAGTSISQITLPETVEAIMSYAFNECKSLKGITIPGSVKTIGYKAFYDASQLSKVTFNEGLESIGECAFGNTSNTMQPIYIPSTLKSVGEAAFSGFICEYVNISDLESWCNIDFGSLRSNPASYSSLYLNGELIKDLVIPESVKAVKAYAFCDIKDLESVTFHDALQSIGEYAFSGCSKLGSSLTSAIIIPGSVTAVGNGAFNETSVRDLTFEYGAEAIEIGSDAFAYINKLSWDRPIESMNLTSLSLTKYSSTITIGNSVTEIPAGMFKGYSVNDLTLGNNLTAIGDEAFSGSNLSEVILPPSVETIGASAFAGNRLNTIIMGHNVKSIGEKAFDLCPAQTVSVTAQTPPAAFDNTFSNYTGSLYVQGQDAVEAYYNADYCWFQFEGHVMIEPTELKVEGDKTLNGKAGDTFQLTATLYPENVTLPHIFWRSTNPDIATVDTNGLVTLHADMSDIMAMAEGDGSSASCKIIAESLYADGPVAEVTVNRTTSDIDEIVTDEEVRGEIDFTAPVEVYNLQGVMVARTADNLAAGFYIVRQGNNVKKIAVK